MERFIGSSTVSWRLLRSRVLFGAALLAALLSGCAGSSTAGTASAKATASVSTMATSAGSGTANGASLPLGDGKIGLTAQARAIMLCSLTFTGGGADQDGPWIDAAAGTWNPALKVAVEGNVSWSQARLQITVQGSKRLITTNDLPKGQPTGIFPIAPSDPAYAYDRNPNHIAAQNLSYTLPADPTPAGQPSCLHGGPIGVTLDGVVLYDGLDGEGRDAVAHEVQDQCDGHPDQSSMYHYHSISPCLMKSSVGSSTLVGYALDGFGIYVERDASGALLTNDALDACHGRVSAIAWDGKQVSMYHYDATAAYPYTLGCFDGTPVVSGGPRG